MSETPERDARIERWVRAARLLNPAERVAYLDRECPDRELRREVEAALQRSDRSHDRSATDPDATVDHQPGVSDSDVTVDHDPDVTVDHAPVTPDSNAADPDATIDHDPDATIGAEAPAAATPADSSERIGHFELLGVLGEGGFGTVYRARQEKPVRREVALKVIKLGMDTKQVIARFDAERQALAVMDHPGIAKVFDAGSTKEGRPYFAMELVQGAPVLEYCDAKRLGTRERIELFIDVCAAIHHAHQKGIIHRDIKPSNVLVAEHDGVAIPKVIDFGIAKATNQELTEQTLFTADQQVIGTPIYMSPEQAGADGVDIDTRCDVYSLGVLLYELLTGTTPFTVEELSQAGFAEMLRIIREVEPRRPSTKISTLGETASTQAEARGDTVHRLQSRLQGDLDWIVMRCLEKERDRRYDSASALMDELRRHLSDEPVMAGPPSASYRFRKFVRRNRGGVLAATIVLVVLVLGVIGTTAGLFWALDEKERADKLAIQEKRAKEDALDSARAEKEAKQEAERSAEAEKKAKREALDSAAAEKQAKQEALESAEAEREAKQDALASAAAEKAAKEEAAAAAREAERRADELAIVAQYQADQLRGADAVDFGLTIRGQLLDTARDAYRREGLDEDAIETRLAELADRVRGVSFTDIAAGTLDTHIFSSAEETIDERFSDQPLVRALLLLELATTVLETLDPERAVPLFVKSYEIRRAELGDDHELTQRSAGFLGHAHVFNRDDAAAEPLLRRALETLEVSQGPTSPDVLTLSWALAELLGRVNPDEAESLTRKVLERCEANPDLPAASRVRAYRELGVCLREQGRAMESILPLRRAVSLARKLLDPHDRDTIQSINSYANSLVAVRQSQQAEPLMREVVELARKAYGDDHPAVIRFVGTLAWTIAMQFRPDREAEQLIRFFVDIALERRGVTDWTVHAPLTALCWLQMRNEQYEQVVKYARLLLEGNRRVGNPEEWGVEASAQQLLGTGLLWQGRAAEAIEPLDIALTLVRNGPPTNPTLGLLEIELGRACLMAGEYERAEELLAAGVRSSSFRLAPFKTEAARYLHAGALTALGRDEDAQAQLDTDLRFLPQDPIELRLTGGNLVELFEKLGNTDRAEEWRKRIEAMPKSTP